MVLSLESEAEEVPERRLLAPVQPALWWRPPDLLRLARWPVVGARHKAQSHWNHHSNPHGARPPSAHRRLATGISMLKTKTKRRRSLGRPMRGKSKLNGWRLTKRNLRSGGLKFRSDKETKTNSLSRLSALARTERIKTFLTITNSLTI